MCTKYCKGYNTCRQSRDATIMRGHFDLQASSNGRKYLSASMKGCFPLGGGRADDGLPSLSTQTKKIVLITKQVIRYNSHESK